MVNLDELAVRCPWDQHPNGRRREPDTQLCTDRHKWPLTFLGADGKHRWVRDELGQGLRCSVCAAWVPDEARETAA